MRYMGGKSRISKQIAEVLNSAINKDAPFVSLFCGSCAIESKVQADVKILNDKHPYLIAMWQALQNGWMPPDVVTKEEYYRVKANMDENLALTGFVGFGSTGVACKELNRDFIGCEIDDGYFEIAKERLN